MDLPRFNKEDIRVKGNPGQIMPQAIKILSVLNPKFEEMWFEYKRRENERIQDEILTKHFEELLRNPQKQPEKLDPTRLPPIRDFTGSSYSTLDDYIRRKK